MDFPFVVVESSTGRIRDGLPTPALIESPTPADAYEDIPGIWRLRDDRYDQPGTEYTSVRIDRSYRYIVDLEVEVVDPSDDVVDVYGAEPERLTLHVVARNRYEAQDLAKQRAIEETIAWAGDVPTIITFISTERQD